MTTSHRAWLRNFLRDRAAAPMVLLAYIFTIIVAIGLQRAVGVTNLLLEIQPRPHEVISFQIVLTLLWPVFLAEFVAYWLAREPDQPFWRTHWAGLIACALPPLRIGALRHVQDGRILLPRLGWREPSKDLRREMERFFSAPMIVVALMILPLLAIEYLYTDTVRHRLWLAVALDIATGFIWLAFTVEFILMFSVARKKVRYLQQHWIDAAIIILPLIAWLRVFRLLRLSRLTYVTRMTRLYRLRGLAIRLLRALLLLGMVQRILYRTPDKRLARLREQVIEKQWEIAEIREEILRTIDDLRKSNHARADTPPEPQPSDTASVHIRPATFDDARAIAALILELGYPANAANVRRSLETYTHAEHHLVLVAEVDAHVVGMISLIAVLLFHRPDRIARVATMVVAETHRGRGIGNALFDEAQRVAGVWNCERLEVTCADHRKDAHAFYESLGFQSRSRRYIKTLKPRLTN